MKNTYTSEQKQTLIRQYLSNQVPVNKLLASAGVPRSTFYGWLRAYQETRQAENRKTIDPRNFRVLETKVERLEGIVEILQKSPCSVQSPLQDRLSYAEQIYSQYSIHMICEALSIDRGTFYNHVLRNKRDNAWYAKRREELRLRIQEVFDENRQVFGAPKITAVLRREGVRVSEKMVSQLMHEMGIQSIRQSAKAMYDEEHKKIKNHLNQKFDTSKPNEVWVGDVTYFKLENHAYYISVIIDLFSRMVIAHRIGKTNSTQLVKSTFKQAYALRQPPEGLIFHTDRGSNYLANAMQNYLQSVKVTHSFSRVHTPYDNSVVESFFASMKKEELYRTKYRSEAEFRTAVDEYILFYNNKRPHGNAQYKTPLEKEEEYLRSNNDGANVSDNRGS
ncbi:MAG: IS3 family transposase [Oscillospiraceae bacterium]|nr:IS3 family transposase [Oscillospiraceae bacterium]